MSLQNFKASIFKLSGVYNNKIDKNIWEEIEKNGFLGLIATELVSKDTVSNYWTHFDMSLVLNYGVSLN